MSAQRASNPAQKAKTVAYPHPMPGLSPHTLLAPIHRARLRDDIREDVSWLDDSYVPYLILEKSADNITNLGCGEPSLDPWNAARLDRRARGIQHCRPCSLCLLLAARCACCACCFLLAASAAHCLLLTACCLLLAALARLSGSHPEVPTTSKPVTFTAARREARTSHSSCETTSASHGQWSVLEAVRAGQVYLLAVYLYLCWGLLLYCSHSSAHGVVRSPVAGGPSSSPRMSGTGTTPSPRRLAARVWICAARRADQPAELRPPAASAFSASITSAAGGCCSLTSQTDSPAGPSPPSCPETRTPSSGALCSTFTRPTQAASACSPELNSGSRTSESLQDPRAIISAS